MPLVVYAGNLSAGCGYTTVQNGVDISVAAKLAGHANLQTTMGYLTFRGQDMKSAVGKL